VAIEEPRHYLCSLSPKIQDLFWIFGRLCKEGNGSETEKVLMSSHGKDCGQESHSASTPLRRPSLSRHSLFTVEVGIPCVVVSPLDAATKAASSRRFCTYLHLSTYSSIRMATQFLLPSGEKLQVNGDTQPSPMFLNALFVSQLFILTAYRSCVRLTAVGSTGWNSLLNCPHHGVSSTRRGGTK
jgi:hypothetical protein